MTNIFLLSFQELTTEDRFTACLEYLLNRVPDLGQQFVDTLCVSTEQPSPKFQKAIDHPPIDTNNRPDFLLECDEFNIICEHKLCSDLGDRQLERYLDLANRQPKKTYLAFISIDEITVSDDVLQSENYLRPDPYPHFCWQDFYSLVLNSNDPLALEFEGLMFRLGMSPPENFEGWEDLLFNPATLKKFQEQWKEVSDHFKKMGANCRRSGSTHPGLVISYPAHWLHLLYLYIEGSNLKGVVWLAETSPYFYAFENQSDSFLSGGNRSIQIRGCKPGKAPWKTKDNLNPYSVAAYYTPLADVLSPDLVATRKALLDVAVAIFDHARGVIEKFDRT